MSLTFLTIAYEYKYLPKLHISIPKHEGIEWTIVKTKDRKLEGFDDIYRVNIIEVDTTEDLQGGFIKMQTGLDSIKEGWFVKMDEDSEVHPNLENIYRKYKDREGIVIGEQDYFNNTKRLPANKPHLGAVDAGNALIHSRCLNAVKWPLNVSDVAPDQTFIHSAWNYFKEEERWIENTPVSYYNSQRGQKDEQDIYK